MSEWTNHQFVLTKVTQNGLALAKADKSLKKDKEIVLAAVKQNYVTLQFADDLLRKDREFILVVVKNDGLAIEFAHKQFTKDREIVLAAVTQNGLAFALIDDSLKKDREVALAAVKENSQSLKYVDESFKTDVTFVYSLFKHDKSYLQYFSSQSTTKWNEAFNNINLYTKLSNDIVEKYSKKYLEEKELYYAIELSSLFTPKSKMEFFLIVTLSNQYTSTFMEKLIIFQILRGMNHEGLKNYDNTQNSESRNYHLFCFRLDKFLEDNPSQPSNTNQLKNIIEKVTNNFNTSCYSKREVNEIMSFAIHWLSNEQSFDNYKQILCKYNELRGDSSKIFKTLNYIYNHFKEDYDFISILGNGGEGVVFKVFHKKSESLRAMKFKYDPEDSVESANETINLLKRTDIEGKIKCFDCDIIQNHLYYVMELGEETLSNYIQRNNENGVYSKDFIEKGKLVEMIEIFIKVLEPLQSFHDNNILHGDIDPQQFVKIGDEYKIIELECAQVIKTGEPITICRGKYSYMPPEVSIDNYSEDLLKYDWETLAHNVGHITTSSDIFSLGCVLLKLLTNCFLKLDEKFLNDPDISKYSDNYVYFTGYGAYFYSVASTNEGEMKLHYAIEKLINHHIDPLLGINELLTRCIITMIQRDSTKRLNCYFYKVILKNLLKYLKGEIPEVTHNITKEISLLKKITRLRSYYQIVNLNVETLNDFTNKEENVKSENYKDVIFLILERLNRRTSPSSYPISKSENYHLFCFRLDKFLGNYPSQTTNNALIANNFDISFYSETEVNEIMSFAINWLSNEQTFVSDYKQILCKYNELRGDLAKIFRALNYYYNYLEKDYDFISILGSGGEGVVFKVFHKESKSLRAMKFKYDPEDSVESANETINLLKRTDIEGKINCFDCAIYQNHLYSVMELGEETLSNYIHRNKQTYNNESLTKYNLTEILEIFIKVLKSVQSIHDKDIAHRDLDPQNIVKIGNVYKIIDFESSRVIKTGNSITIARGKYTYMSPEVSHDNYTDNLFKDGDHYKLAHNVGQITTSSDIFSLGCILLKLLTNCPLQLNERFVTDADISKYKDNSQFFTSYGKYFYTVLTTTEGEMKLHYAIEKLINRYIDPLFGINELLTRCIITMIQRDATKRLNCYLHRLTIENIVKFLKGEIKDIALNIQPQMKELKEIITMKSYSELYNENTNHVEKIKLLEEEIRKLKQKPLQ